MIIKAGGMLMSLFWILGMMIETADNLKEQQQFNIYDNSTEKHWQCKLFTDIKVLSFPASLHICPWHIISIISIFIFSLIITLSIKIIHALHQ